jgi:hypothetical protein
MGVGTDGQFDGASVEGADAARREGIKVAEAPAAASAVPSRKRRRARPDFVSEFFGGFSWFDMSAPSNNRIFRNR